MIDMNNGKDLLIKNKKIIIYFLCSAFTALLEAILLLIFKRFIPLLGNIVYANTIAIFLSSIIHYILTSKFAFKVRMSFLSLIVYIATFLIGVLIQNAVIWVSYQKILISLIENDNLRTILSKGVSLTVSFFITYFIRQKLNLMIKKKEEAENE